MHLTGLQKTLWATAGVAVLAFGGWAAFRSVSPAPLPAPSVVQLEPFRPAFALPDAAGCVVTSADFAGRFQLVFFGFTNCPDVCPTTLAEVAQVMDDLGTDAARVQPVFVSVDPVRDRALGIGDYVAAFHPSILGLAGDEAATRAAADSFKIYFARESQAGAPGGYTMAHSPALYLIGPEGDWVRQFAYGTPTAEITADLRSRI